MPHVPRAPSTIEETGLTADRLGQLFIKSLYTGEATGVAIPHPLRLPYSVFDSLTERARAEHLIEVRGTAGSGSAAYRYALTDLGRDRARQYLATSHYSGPAPVPLADYVYYMRRLR